MPNLGTKAGKLMPSSGSLIAGDPNHPGPSISEYGKRYGTYSGADIKVVVHYPRDPNREKNLNRLKSELENRLTIVEENYRAISSPTAAQSAAYSTNVAYLNSEIMNLSSAVTSANGPATQELGEVQSVSWSTFREKNPVRCLGSCYPRSYVRGPRSIAGTMIFTIFHEHVFHEIMRLNLRHYNTGVSDYDRYIYTTMLIDQLPPLDFSFVFANEYGATSHMRLYGVEFFQEGGVFSIEDIFSENVVQYVARDMDPLRIVETREIDGRGVTEDWQTTASDLLRDNTEARRNPFI